MHHQSQLEETYEEADYCLSVEEITFKHPPRASQQTIVYSDTEEDEPVRPQDSSVVSRLAEELQKKLEMKSRKL
jgi:hypothetical protein